MVTGRQELEQAVLRRFDDVAARGTEQNFAYPTGDAGLRGLGYPSKLLGALPTEIRSRFCGVGNMHAAVSLRIGEHVLDVGCGCGVDTLLAALRVGSQGWAVGLDRSGAMLDLARWGARESGTNNCLFALGSAESLPWTNSVFDCVLSNGVFSLIPDKKRAISEIHRVLKPGGRVVIADQTRLSTAPPAVKNSAGGWAL